MLTTDARLTQSYRFCGLLAVLMLLMCAACDVYDARLVTVRMQPDATVTRDAGDADAADSGDDGGGEEQCIYVENSEFCPVHCPESCNGQDDDCDSFIDESSSGPLCKLQSATAVCVGGSCLIAACQDGRVDCNGLAEDGCESELEDVEHCGSCSNRCELANATPACDAGQCTIASCDIGWDDCDGKAANGCERALTVLTDCGACGVSCKVPHAITECSTGTCRFQACEVGWADCNEDADQPDGDGCETDLGTTTNCGACGTSCPSEKPYCTGGRCTAIVCAVGTADCDGDNVACETDLRTVDNCGACGAACGSVANASVSCDAQGQCQPTCNPGWASCDDSFSNGCETDIHSLANCGACGTSCSHNNAVSSCANGDCSLAMCNTGYGDCNGDPNDGCEERLNTSTHCGECGRPCSLSNASSSCSSGSCQVSSCNAGYGNCDGNPSNGCETNLRTNAQHCNACGAACPAGFLCQAGTCVCDSNSDCPSGQSCCNGACIDTRTSAAHCGGCGMACGSGESCCNGSCRNLQTDVNNCGSCGRSCGSNSNRCSNGSCRCTNDSPCSGFLRCCSSGCRLPLVCN